MSDRVVCGLQSFVTALQRERGTRFVLNSCSGELIESMAGPAHHLPAEIFSSAAVGQYRSLASSHSLGGYLPLGLRLPSKTTFLPRESQL